MAREAVRQMARSSVLMVRCIDMGLIDEAKNMNTPFGKGHAFEAGTYRGKKAKHHGKGKWCDICEALVDRPVKKVAIAAGGHMYVCSKHPAYRGASSLW